jgi:choline dehydrogenase-like flavoprotein
MSDRFDAVVVGTGFASSFFLHRFLAGAGPAVRVLVLEAGERKDHARQLQEGVQRSSERLIAAAGEHFVNRNPEKLWVFTLGFGGGSNCWWGNTPRMLPADFRLKSRYGVGEDWPFDYDDLEPFYCDAEDLMAISGPEGPTPAPRSRPYPQPPHRLSEPDKRLAAAFGDRFVPLACARPRVATTRRPGCCANSVCRLCPIDSKFTVLNELAWLYDDPRVELRLGAKVIAVETGAGRVDGVRYRMNGRELRASGDLVVLGANALFNAHILLASGLDEGGVGEGLVEQVSRTVEVFLDGLDNFQGTSSHSGHGYMFYDGEHRRRHGAVLVETANAPQLRHEPGKWRHYLSAKFICENLREPRNHVRIDAESPAKPATTFVGHSDYASRALDAIESYAETFVAPLPVERIKVGPVNPAEAHIMGTTVMGRDPRSSVVDGDCVHHRLRNLVVLGSGTFPTASPANPTLTIAAVALRAAARLTRAGDQT